MARCSLCSRRSVTAAARSTAAPAGSADRTGLVRARVRRHANRRKDRKLPAHLCVPTGAGHGAVTVAHRPAQLEGRIAVRAHVFVKGHRVRCYVLGELQGRPIGSLGHLATIFSTIGVPGLVPRPGPPGFAFSKGLALGDCSDSETRPLGFVGLKLVNRAGALGKGKWDPHRQGLQPGHATGCATKLAAL